LCVLFMGIHGARRLYECLFIQKHSNSQMWIGHYLLGMTYYLFAGIGMWCEGGGNLQNLRIMHDGISTVFKVIIIVCSVLVYVFFSWMQHLVHIDLSKLHLYTCMFLIFIIVYINNLKVSCGGFVYVTFNKRCPLWNKVPVIPHDEEVNVVPDRNWRSTLTAAEKHAVISHL
ncbi:hypothetical protein PCK2_001034, partial [Pneumocystis canis]